ncbi:MAG: alpha/beta fold hydrolase [Gemmatimonadaceae bacterium]
MALPGRMPPGDLFPSGEPDIAERFIRIASGIRLRVIESGSRSAQPILILPGWGCTAWLYREPLVALAAAGYRSIIVELKGQGLSDKPLAPGEYTLPAMRDNLIGALNALSIPVAGIVGHSMGASIAVHAALVAPDRVTGIALVAPVGFAGVKGMAVFRALTPAFIAPALVHIASPLVVKTMLEIVHGDFSGPTPRDVEEMRAPTRSPEYTQALRSLLHEFTWDAEFPQLAVSRTVIVGTRDHLSPAAAASRYAGARPPVVIEGAGHVLFSEQPEIVNAELIGFFGSTHRSDYISAR